MTRKSVVLLFIVSIFAFQGHGFEISGKAPEFKGSFLRLYIVNDFISFQEQKIDVVKIADDGSFIFRVPYGMHALVKLRIESSSTSLIVPPDAQMVVELKDDVENNRGRIYDRQLISVIRKGDQGINELIWEFQKEQASFIDKNYEKFVTKTILPEIEKFSEAMLTRFEDVQQLYFMNFLKSELAAMEDAALGGEKKVYETTLKNEAVAYDNLGYMDLFVQFYQERFIQLSQGKDGFQVLSNVNGTQDYLALLELVLKHPFIPNDTLAELFIVFGLKEVYHDKTFKKQKVMDLLIHIAANGKHYQNRKIAQAVVKELLFLTKGTIAPDFSLKNDEGQVIHLSDFKGRPVLLFFWSAASRMSLMQLSWLKEYHERYQEQLAIIGVNMDDDRAVYDQWASRNSSSWLSLFKDKQYDVIDKFRLTAMPVFALIDKEGKIVRYPAPLPEENLELELNRMFSE